MPKEDLSKLLDESKADLEQDYKNLEQSLINDLDSFKKNILTKI